MDYLRDLWNRLRDWLDSFSQSSPLLFNLFLAALIILLVVILVHLGYLLWNVLRPRAASTTAAGAAAPRLADAQAYLERAEALARSGRYVDALGHRFIAALLELERVRALRYHPSKTPAEYIPEAKLDAAGRDSLADLVARLYRHLFGAVPCDEFAYRAFGAAAQIMVRHVVPG